MVLDFTVQMGVTLSDMTTALQHSFRSSPTTEAFDLQPSPLTNAPPFPAKFIKVRQTPKPPLNSLRSQ